MRLSKKIFAGLLLLFSALVLPLFSWEPPSSLSPDFSGIEENLNELENLIINTLSNSENLSRQLADLKANLSERERLLSERETSMREQERSLKTLREQLGEMSETYRKQSALSAKYEQSSRFWKRFTLIGIPAALVLSGGITGAIFYIMHR